MDIEGNVSLLFCDNTTDVLQFTEMHLIVRTRNCSLGVFNACQIWAKADDCTATLEPPATASDCLGAIGGIAAVLLVSARPVA